MLPVVTVGIKAAPIEGTPMADEIEKPPRIPPRIKAAPIIRNVYYCDFWKDAQLPEFWKTRPVIVVSYKNTLIGPCTVIPLSTGPQEGNPWAHKLSVMVDGERQSWAVCNYPMTVAVSRLSQIKGKVPRVPQKDFDAILALLLKWLPKLPQPQPTENKDVS